MARHRGRKGKAKAILMGHHLGSKHKGGRKRHHKRGHKR